MPLDRSLVSILALAGVALGALGLLAAVGSHRRLGRLHRTLLLLQRDGDADSFLTAAGRSAEEVAGLTTAVRRMQADHRELQISLAGAVRHVAVVRYDALPDLGGRLSFSVALLDAAADGVVLSAITGRSDTRTYAKAVTAGRGERALSPEEEQAVTAALAGGRHDAPRTPL